METRGIPDRTNYLAIYKHPQRLCMLYYIFMYITFSKAYVCSTPAFSLTVISDEFQIDMERLQHNLHRKLRTHSSANAQVMKM